MDNDDDKSIHGAYLLWPDIPVRNVKRDIIDSLAVVLTSVTCRTCNWISKERKITQKSKETKKKRKREEIGPTHTIAGKFSFICYLAVASGCKLLSGKRNRKIHTYAKIMF